MQIGRDRTGLLEPRCGGKQYETVFVLLLLIGITLVYAQTLGFSFLLWDDPAYVLRDPVRKGLTVAGMRHAFTSLVMTHWHPLTVVAHMLDVEIFGLSPGAHHGMNVLVHALNSLLLFSLLRSTTGRFWLSAFVTALWALHPLHVENVAWISDRKDLLCTLFGLLALHAYVRFAASRRRGWHALVLLLYCVGMLSKSMIVTLPVMCLLMDYWPLRRFDFGFPGAPGPAQNGSSVDATHPGVNTRSPTALLVEKIPLLVLMLGFSVFTYATTQHGGFLEYYGRAGLAGRLVNSLCSHAWYVAKTVWPTRLAALYVHPNLPGGTPWQGWQIAGSVLVLAALSWTVWRLRRPYLVVGWLWFLGTLAPVNGLVQYGNLSRADRCMYIPMIGLLLMAVWGTSDLIERVRVHAPALKKLGAVVGTVALVAIATACWVQTGYWRNSITFYERQIRLVPNNPYFNSNLALAYCQSAQFAKAIYHANKALDAWPRVWQSHQVLADVYRQQGNAQLARYHQAKSDDMRAELQQEHARSLSRNPFAAGIGRLLGTQ
jgi:protein O-mannosyl-transferase